MANPIVITEKTIDLKGVIAGKNPALLHILPRGLIRYMRRIVHEKELNEGLYRLKDVSGLDFVDGALQVLDAEIDLTGAEKFPDRSKVIVVSNHPLGGLDGLALIQAIGRRYGSVKVPANDLILSLPNVRDLLVPVNKHGSNRDNLRILEETFAGDAPILHFPAGLCSRKRGGIIRDLPWQKSFIVRARRYRREIVPVYFDGQNSRFFYGLANLRKRLGIRANLEMVYLVDEMFKQRGAALRAVVGSPISWQTFDKRLNDWRWAQQVKHHVYTLANDPESRFRFLEGGV